MTEPRVIEHTNARIAWSENIIGIIQLLHPQRQACLAPQKDSCLLAKVSKLYYENNLNQDAL